MILTIPNEEHEEQRELSRIEEEVPSQPTEPPPMERHAQLRRQRGYGPTLQQDADEFASFEAKIDAVKKQIVHNIIFHCVILALYFYHIYLNRGVLHRLLTSVPSCFSFALLNLIIYISTGTHQLCLYLNVRRLFPEDYIDLKMNANERFE